MDTTIKASLSKQDLKTLESVRDMLIEVSEWRKGISAQTVAYVLDIIVNEGTPPSEVAVRCKAERTAVSKQLSTLTKSSNNLTASEGMDYIKTVPDPTYWRQKNLYFTPKGKKAAEKLIQHLFEETEDVHPA